MRIKEIETISDFKLRVLTEDGKTGIFNVTPYLKFEAFQQLKDQTEFNKIINGGYFVEWECGADLSADTIVAHLKIQ